MAPFVILDVEEVRSSILLAPTTPPPQVRSLICEASLRELRKPEPTLATSVLGHRQVKIVKDIHVNVDQQAVETPGPPWPAGLRVDPPTEAGNISLIRDRDASSSQGTQQAGSPQGFGASFLARRVGPRAGRSADDVEPPHGVP